jgi:hypothetical protein
MVSEWIQDGRTIRGELTASQVADMTAAGVRPDIVRGYRCTLGAERHWGEHTEAEIAALTVDGWTCEVGESWPFEINELPTQEQLFLTEAQQILTRDEGAVFAVQRVIQRVATVAALGVDISEWTIQGILDAADAAIANNPAASQQIRDNATSLLAEWIRVVYHCNDSFSTADRLWPYLYTIVTGA